MLEESAVEVGGGFSCALVGGGLEDDGRVEVVGVEKFVVVGILTERREVVSCAKDDAGRIKARRSTVEENGRLD